MSLPAFANLNDNFRHLLRKNGLSANRTYQAIEDKEGFVWITTYEGVDRFDGQEIVHYKLPMHDEIASQGYQFNYILIDKDNTIFIVNNRGYVFKLNRMSDKFELLKDFEEIYGRYVFNAMINSKKQIILGTPEGLIVYDYRTQRFIESKVDVAVFSIMEYENGYLIGLINGIARLSSDFQTYKKLGKWNEAVGYGIRLRTLSYDSLNQRIWFGTQNSGLNYFDIRLNKYFKSNLHKNLSNFPIWDIKLVNDTTMLVGTDGAGMFVIDLQKIKIKKHYTHNPDYEGSINSNVIHGILVSSENIYFITTDIGGVSVLTPLKPGFKILKREKNNVNSLKNNTVRSIKELPFGTIVFGTDRGVSFWDRQSNSWEHLNNETDIGRNKVVTSMACAKNGALWVGYFLGNNSIKKTTAKYNKLPDDIKHSRNPKAMFFDEEQNTLWIGRSGRQIRLLSYNYKTNAISKFVVPEISDIESMQGKILVGTHSGLYIIDKNTRNYHKCSKLNEKLNRISCLFIDSKNRLWLGSDGAGLVRMNIFTDDSVFVFNEEKGLASNQLFSIEEDNIGRIWLATKAGLSVINPQSGKIINYFESDGADVGEFMNNASCKTSDGYLLFGGTSGVIMFKPENFKNYPKPKLNLFFTSLYVNQKKITEDSTYIFKKRLDSLEYIYLNHNENSFSLSFTNIDFLHPQQAKYSWILEGYDKKWTSASLTNKATYSNIPPGNYVFRVRLISYLMSDIEPFERTIKIEIKLPWYKTFWAYTLYITVIIGLIFLVLYYNKLKIEVKSTSDKLRYLINMAHEIKTPLTLIRAPISDLIQKSENESDIEKLEMAMANVGKLQKKIGQFLDFKRINQIENIQPELMDAVAFIQKKIFAFKLTAKRQNIDLNLRCNIDRLDIYSSTELLDKIINNLLSNAIKYNTAGGTVNIYLFKEGDVWGLTIEDSGIGIPEKEQNKIFSLFFRASNALESRKTGSGVGLVLVREMVNVLHGKLEFSSKENTGTTFKLLFPIGEINAQENNLIQAVTKQPLEKEKHEAQKDKIKILIAEDEEELRAYIKKELSSSYAIIESNNGFDALALIRQELPDLVLSDVFMPQMNGRQLCMNIKSDTSISHIPVLLVSGLDSKDEILKGLAAGADDYMTKPFDPSILKAKIESLINNRKVLKTKIINADRIGLETNIRSEIDKAFVKKITTMVEDNLSDPDFSSQMFYTSVGMSRTAFYHKLKSLIDLSPAEFIRLVRLNKAKELLLSKKYNINEVAYRCGFSNAKYFSTAFKRQFGQSPSSFIAEK
jgi:signal transduction histidine kinase/DNA-binding response OmpR family regulator/ligand-binding sensor domain-containing protein